jgi:hypothetical protein
LRNSSDNLAIPRRLLGLPHQHRQLLRQLLQHIIDAQKVLLGPRQLQLRLVPPRIKPEIPAASSSTRRRPWAWR